MKLWLCELIGALAIVVICVLPVRAVSLDFVPSSTTAYLRTGFDIVLNISAVKPMALGTIDATIFFDPSVIRASNVVLGDPVLDDQIGLSKVNASNISLFG
jgi:hypothetical protein